MDFFGIGWEELLLIFVIAVFIFGPGKIPEFARTLGKIVREINKYSSALTRDFKEEFEKGLQGTEENKESRIVEEIPPVNPAGPSKPGVGT